MYGPQGDKCGKMASCRAICGVMGIFEHREDDETVLFLQKILKQVEVFYDCVGCVYLFL